MEFSRLCSLSGALFMVLLSTQVDARRLPMVDSFFLPRETVSGFQLAPQGSFAGFGLADSCEKVLYQTINCDSSIANLGRKAYHGSPGDKAFTDTVCSTACSTALKTARRRVAGACASTSELFEGYPVLALIDSVISGWDETCLKDTDGGYCNAKIEAFQPVDELADMPKDQLCSFCNVEKLRLMQKSPYSAYDSFHAERLSYINQNCGKAETPIEPQEPTIKPNGTLIDNCVTGSKYTVEVGDTCNSIAREKSISATSLYYINPSLLNCNDPTPGIELCLPLACETTYTVQEGEDCVAIGVDQATSWQNIIQWNAGLNSRCSNIWSSPTASAYWGNVICVSAPGGVSDETTGPDNDKGMGNGNIGGPGGSGNGYADEVVAPPSGGTVAQGTTAECGRYVQAEEGATCAKLIVKHAVPIDRFLKANPSLRNPERCSGYLRHGLWYCVLPVEGFDATLL